MRLVVLCLTLLPVICMRALAETGVSDERVVLPEGPGAIGGIGENASVSGNMGAFSYALPIEIPAGFPSATPTVDLTYNSLASNGKVGIGWDVRIPYIERSSLRGLPTYGTEDTFTADGTEELVRVRTSLEDGHTYRARFEGGFVLYIWHADAHGSGGYWEAQYPDGGRGFFGADAEGVQVDTARTSHPQRGVFRYLLVEMRDRFNHRVRYDYTFHDNYPLIRQVRYVFHQGEARYRVAFRYESRPDTLSSALPGFDLRLTKRLSGIEVFSSETRIGRYALRYEQETILSHLASVHRFGLHDELSPIAYSFGYSAANPLYRSDRARPIVFEMGKLQATESGGVDLRNGRATLIDINGDSLPDLLDTGVAGHHRFFLNRMYQDGSQSFDPPAASQHTSNGSSFQLNAPSVHVVDINGDGLSDMVDTNVNRVLCNLGQSDWVEAGPCANNIPVFEMMAADSSNGGDPRHFRFMDYDGDKRIDVLHTAADDAALVLHNTPDGTVARSIEPVGAMFDEGPLQLADINGDGLLDPVTVGASGSTGVIRYRLNLGFGHWTSFEQRAIPGVAAAELTTAEIQDLNGDGLDDVVMVSGDSVKFALNRAGDFQTLQTLRSSDVSGLPTFDMGTSVIFADMNGSGSTDVVWIDANRSVRVLELYPDRSNLLTRIDNGIGGVHLIEYGTSAREYARDRDTRPWRFKLPHAMNVVTATVSFVALTPSVQQRVEYAYRDGYYDGLEKRYRGFGAIETNELGDDTQESRQTIRHYDVGASDAYYAGRLLHEQVVAQDGKQSRLVQRVAHHYEDCEVSGVPSTGLPFPVRYVCDTSTETLLQEGRPEAEWVTLRTAKHYDGYGNVVVSLDLGVVGVGKDGREGCTPCAAPQGIAGGACGQGCFGDERHVETTHIAPGEATTGVWVLGRIARQITYGSPTGPFTEQLYYYDGDPFVGLHGGKARTGRTGLLRRVCIRQSSQAKGDCEGPGWVLAQRSDHDSHGNVVDSLDPLGQPNDDTGHRRLMRYDPTGLRTASLDVLLSEHGNKYRLRQEIAYDPTFDLPAMVSGFRHVGTSTPSDLAVTPVTRIGYDGFGRVRAVAEPGDTLEAPTSEVEYTLSTPVSQVVFRRRTESGAPADLEERTCLDGFGRAVQTRTRLSEGVYQTTKLRQINARGLSAREYDPYQGAAACDSSAPGHVPYRSYDYDALGRIVRTTSDDASLYGEPSVARATYFPLGVTQFDAEDNDKRDSALHAPTTVLRDGLNQIIRIEKKSAHGTELAAVGLFYDALGNLAETVDPAGTQKRQQYDLLGRLIGVDDANAGTTRMTYDVAGNMTSKTDGRGITLHTEYDGANRTIARFEQGSRAETEVRTRYDLAPDCTECTNAAGQAAVVEYPLGKSGMRGRDESGYDVRGRPVFSARTLEGHRFVSRHIFDNVGRKIATTHPDGTVLKSTFDAASRLQRIDGALSRVAYDDLGLMREVLYENGIRWSLDFDVVRRLQRSRTITPDGRTLQGLSYTYDRVGNMLAVTDVSDVRSDVISWGVRYALDSWYRQTGARYDDGEQVDLTFDVADNVLSKVSSLGARSQAHVGEYSYDSLRPNAVSVAGDLHYRYDEAGHALSRGDIGLEWDREGRLGIARHADVATHYAYAASGQERVLEWGSEGRIYRVGPDFEVRDGVAVTYARLGSRRVSRSATAKLATKVLRDTAPADGDGRIDVADAWMTARQGIDPRDHLRAAARLLLLQEGAPRVFLHSDHFQSLTAATGPQAELLGERSYYESGEPREGHGYVDSHGFSGQLRDLRTGLTHYRFRDLDTRVGRWMSPDPLFVSLTPEMLFRWGEATTGYAYVGNRWPSEFDPNGLLGTKIATTPYHLPPRHVTQGPYARRTVGFRSGGLPNEQLELAKTSDGSASVDAEIFEVGSRVPSHMPAAWGVSDYRRGGTMTTMEHIMGRHASDSKFEHVSRFAKGTRPFDIVRYVDEALSQGRIVESGPGGVTVEHQLQQPIGTNIAGEAASTIRVVVNHGVIKTAYPL